MLSPTIKATIQQLKTLGILNITQDSFSDGGEFLEENASIEHAKKLIDDGADILDIGAASSHPDANKVATQTEIERLSPVINFLKNKNIPISIDSFNPTVQLFALEQGIDYLNDVNAFKNPEIYPN